MPDSMHQLWCSLMKGRLSSDHSFMKMITNLVQAAIHRFLIFTEKREAILAADTRNSDTGQKSRSADAKSRSCRWFPRIALWNWKSAILSVAFRVPVFAIVTMRRGLGAMTGAVMAETFVCAVYAGCYAAVVQYIRNRRPVWLTALIIAVVLPALGQVIEYEVHAWRSTPHRILAVTISSILSALSSLFNWYVMRQGTFLVGSERSSFVGDLRRFPVLLWRFFLVVPRWLMQRMGWDILPSN
jgi:hypothetical protein